MITGDRIHAIVWLDGQTRTVDWSYFSVVWTDQQYVCLRPIYDTTLQRDLPEDTTPITVPTMDVAVLQVNGRFIANTGKRYKTEIDVTAAVMGDLIDRSKLGERKYGERLYAGSRCNNDKSNLQNLYEELLDAACYLKKQMMEGV